MYYVRVRNPIPSEGPATKEFEVGAEYRHALIAFGAYVGATGSKVLPERIPSPSVIKRGNPLVAVDPDGRYGGTMLDWVVALDWQDSPGEVR